METTHINQITWNLRCASVAERDELLTYAATCGIACAPPVSAADLGLGWNDQQDKLYLFPAEWAGQPESGRTYELISADQFRTLVTASVQQNAAKCEATMAVTQPAITHEEFLLRAEAQAAAQHLLALPTIEYTPARAGSAARTSFYVQVWDTRLAFDAGELGSCCFSVREASAAECLSKLAEKLREHEERAYEADPSRQGEQLCDMYQELDAYGLAA